MHARKLRTPSASAALSQNSLASVRIQVANLRTGGHQHFVVSSIIVSVELTGSYKMHFFNTMRRSPGICSYVLVTTNRSFSLSDGRSSLAYCFLLEEKRELKIRK